MIHIEAIHVSKSEMTEQGSCLLLKGTLEPWQYHSTGVRVMALRMTTPCLYLYYYPYQVTNILYGYHPTESTTPIATCCGWEQTRHCLTFTRSHLLSTQNTLQPHTHHWPPKPRKTDHSLALNTTWRVVAQDVFTSDSPPFLRPSSPLLLMQTFLLACENEPRARYDRPKRQPAAGPPFTLLRPLLALLLPISRTNPT